MNAINVGDTVRLKKNYYRARKGSVGTVVGETSRESLVLVDFKDNKEVLVYTEDLTVVK